MRPEAGLFHGFADAMRMAILAFLARRGEASVGELVEVLGAPQPRVSNHLRCLAWCGYVRARQEGKHVYYPVADERVLEILRPGEAIPQDNFEHVEASEIAGGC